MFLNCGNTFVFVSLSLLPLVTIITCGSSSSLGVTVEAEEGESPHTTTPWSTFVDNDINAKKRKTEILDRILDSTTYDTKIRPKGLNGSGPVNIDIDINFRRIENINDIKMEYTVQILFRQRWVDVRLDYSEFEQHVTYLQLLTSHRIWVPDVFFENEKTGILHALVIPNVFTRVYPNGTVLQSFRLTILLACPMNLRAYPLDIQKCPFRMANFGYTTNDAVLHWKPTNPIQHEKINMPQFNILSFTPHSCTSVTSSGNYSCIGVDIHLKRAFGFFLIQIYIPCAMLVMVSWVSFWLEPTAVEARLSLGVTAILTIVTQTYGINQSAPPSSYIKALDVWTAICQLLVFSGLLEFALVNYMTRLGHHFDVIKEMQSLTQSINEDVDNEPQIESKFQQLQKCMERAKRVDKMSQIAFPIVFFLFNIAYWTSYGLVLRVDF